MQSCSSAKRQNNARLGQLFGAALTWVDGALLVADNNSLTALQLPKLEHARQISVETSPALQTIEMPALIDTTELLFIMRNPSLHHIAFDSLTSAGLFFVTGNPRLPSCEVRAVFTHVTGVVSQSGNDDTAPCGP